MDKYSKLIRQTVPVRHLVKFVPLLRSVRHENSRKFKSRLPKVVGI